jgi:hypothetical protein
MFVSTSSGSDPDENGVISSGSDPDERSDEKHLTMKV